MKDITKQALRYYVRVTGNTWHKFFSEIDEALEGDLKSQEGSLWYTHILLNTLKANGVDIEDIKINKDAIKAVFEEGERKSNGEFFTPEIWCKEGRTYFDKHIPNWKTDYYIWDICAGSGNLLRTCEVDDRSRLFLSTLQSDDVKLIKATEEFANCHVFEMDFLNTIACSNIDEDFLHSLPDELQDVILNDKPLIIYANPPYKSGKNKATEVGRYMGTTSNDPSFDYIDFSAPAYDLFYQFCFQVMCMAIRYKLTNLYYCFFGPLRYFTGKQPGVLLEYFEHVFEFQDGMCLSAGEFNDIGKEVTWGIGCSLWKSFGEFRGNIEESYHKDVLLDKKYVTPDGDIQSYGKVLYERSKINLMEWTKCKDEEIDFYKNMPLMTSYHTFKGGEPLDNKVYDFAKVPDNPTFLGTLMIQDNLARNSAKSAILMCPTTITHLYIMQENFWRCVANFAFRRVASSVDWSMTKKDMSAPNPNIEGYDKWLKNALVLFLFEYKAMQSSIRDAVDVKTGEHYSINNTMFYCTPDEVRQYCHDEKILEDLENHPSTSNFFMEQLSMAYPEFEEPARNLFDWCKTYTLASYDFRKQVGYKCSLNAWDAGFQQIRCALWKDELTDEYAERIAALREYLEVDLYKFGFIKDLED